MDYISGLEIRTVPVVIATGAAKNGVIDHNLIVNANVSYRATQGPPAVYPSDHVLERNRMLNTGTWNVDPAYPTIPWTFIKLTLTINGQATGWGRVGATAEITAVHGRGGAHRLVIRNNTIDGFFNGVGGYNVSFDRYSQLDTDVHDNLIMHIADDAFEPGSRPSTGASGTTDWSMLQSRSRPAQ